MDGDTRKLNRIAVRLAAVVALGLAVDASGAPTVTVAPPSGAARPGDPYPLRYAVTWRGSPDEYRVVAPHAPAVPWGTLEWAEAMASGTDGENQVVFTLVATADAPGEHAIPELVFSFSSPEDLTPPEAARRSDPPPSPVVHPQLRADPLTLRVSQNRALVFASGGLGALLLSGAAVAWLARRRTRRSAAAAGPSGLEAARLALYEARRHRLDGALYPAYSSMAAAVAIVAPDSPLKAQLDATARDVGYRGARPADDAVEADLRAVERAVRGAPPL
jgi:hypothetical protein